MFLVGESVELDIELGSYSVESGLRLVWQMGFELRVRAAAGEVVLSGNEAGLRSLAQHLLTLSQEHVPTGVHAHMEPGLELEDDSTALVIEKYH